MKPIIYIISLALVLSGLTVICFYLIAHILETYTVYVGIYPFGTWTHPFAWMAPTIRLFGQVAAIIIFVAFTILKALREQA